VRERRARIDECLMTIFGYGRRGRESRRRIDVCDHYMYIHALLEDIILLLLFVSMRPRVLCIYNIHFFFHFMQTSKANDRRRQTDRLKQRDDWRTADGPAVISAPGQISINNVRQGFQYKPSPLVAAAASAAVPIFPATRQDVEIGSAYIT